MWLSLKSAREVMKIVRGGAISMIFQEPMASFAPAITIGKQMVEQLQLHSDMTKQNGRKEISVEMLDRVGISDPVAALRPIRLRTFGRHAAAGDDRDGAFDKAQAPDRGRTDNRA